METNYLSAGFAKIDRDLRELMACLDEVLEELGENEIRHRLPWVNGNESEVPGIRGLEQAYSIAFQLLNIVEENASARTRRLREIHEGLASERGLWGNQLSRLAAKGWTPEEITASLPGVRVEAVFTAHPTEAKRGAVLDQKHDRSRDDQLEAEHLDLLVGDAGDDDVVAARGEVDRDLLERIGDVERGAGAHNPTPPSLP